MPGMPAPPALARRSTGDRPPSVAPTRSAMLLAGGRPNTPTVFYQSEHRTFGQQPVSPAAVSRSTSPSGFPDGGGDGGVGGRKQRPMTMSEEGIVHFSIPARVPGNRGSGTNGGGDGGGGEETMVVFVVELWQVVNRSRRVRKCYRGSSSLPAMPLGLAFFYDVGVFVVKRTEGKILNSPASWTPIFFTSMVTPQTVKQYGGVIFTDASPL